MAFTEEQKQCAANIVERKKIVEANIVFSIYKNPSILDDYDLTRADFLQNDYRVLFEIANEIYLEGNTNTLDEIAIGTYLESHSQLNAVYEAFGGYDVIIDGSEMVEQSNITYYIEQNTKYLTLLRLIQAGYPIWTKIDIKDEEGRNFWDYSINEIYDMMDFDLNNIFSKVSGSTQIVDITHNGRELIEEWDKGMLVGLPYHEFPRLNDITGGMLEGNITLVCATSNSGKSSIMRQLILPSFLKNNEPSLTILNEEPRARWLMEMIASIINNEFAIAFNKTILRNGNFTPEQKDLIMRAYEELEKMKEEHLLNFLEFDFWNTDRAIKEIKKCANSGINNFIIDTFKMDSDRGSKKMAAWEQLKENMVNLYNCVRKKNVHVTATVQLSTFHDKTRFLTLDCIGESKGMVESVSTVIMMRKMWRDEYHGERQELIVYNIVDGMKKAVNIEDNKTYYILFVNKTRSGSKDRQVVAEVDFAHNCLKEIGYTNVPFSV